MSPGRLGVAEMAANMRAEGTEIPAGLWAELTAEGLLREDVSV